MSNTPNTIEETLKDFVNKYLDEKFGEYAEDNTHLAEALAAIYQLIEREVIGITDTAFNTYGSYATYDDHKRLETYEELRKDQRQRLANLMKGKKS